MLRLRVIGFWGCLLLLISCTGGCYQVNNRLDDEKDPHFQRGRDFASGQDFKAAAAEFEKALEDNPRSAAAHFELGWLYDTKLTNYAAAIYHYQKHLDLQPSSERASLIKDRIRGCKQQLANNEFPLPNTWELQRQIDRLRAENHMLKLQLQTITNDRPAMASAGPVAQIATTRTHVVKPHETLASIASEYGLKTSDVLAANSGINPRRLRVGQSVNLP
jgi:tetratricopeptide (TPR) repeat protein